MNAETFFKAMRFFLACYLRKQALSGLNFRQLYSRATCLCPTIVPLKIRVHSKRHTDKCVRNNTGQSSPQEDGVNFHAIAAHQILLGLFIGFTLTLVSSAIHVAAGQFFGNDIQKQLGQQ